MLDDSSIINGYRGGMDITVRSEWLTDKEEVLYFNKVAHIARVNLRSFKKEGFTGYKITHYLMDKDEFVEGIEVKAYMSRVDLV